MRGRTEQRPRPRENDWLLRESRNSDCKNRMAAPFKMIRAGVNRRASPFKKRDVRPEYASRICEQRIL